MIPAPFDYIAPSTVDEAVRVLSEAEEDEVTVIAGGQSLLPVLRMRLAAPAMLVDLRKINELHGVQADGDLLEIGAMTTHDDLQQDSLVCEHALLLAKATRTVADPQVRHRGTLGGSLAHADPAGDLLAPMLAMDAQMVISGTTGTRTVPAVDFFADFFTTAMEPNEILTQIRVPKFTGWRAHYEKFNRVAQAWSIVGVAATVRTEAGMITEARVGLTNMSATPVRAHEVEEALLGRPADEEVIRTAAQHAAAGTNPVTDGNADAEYRRHLARVLTGRALTTAVAG